MFDLGTTSVRAITRRRPSARSLFAFVTVLALAFPSQANALEPATTAKRPNIIVILTDDMGYSDIGCYGGEMSTPNLDSLAKNGLRFTQFYNTARCCPTRACLLTGMYPHQVGMGHMTNTNNGYPGYRGDLSHDSPTVGERMTAAGYDTAHFGKWHVSGNGSVKPDGVKDNWPHARGFGTVYGTINGAGDFFDPPSLVRGDKMLNIFTDTEYSSKDYYYTDALGDHAAKYIRDRQNAAAGKPFFIYLAFTTAHWPMQAPEAAIAKYQGKYDGGYEPIRTGRLAKLKELGLLNTTEDPAPQVGDWSNIKHKEWEARCREVYAAMIDKMDENVGKVVGALKATGQFENTAIFYMQDNGACQENLGRTFVDRGKIEPWTKEFISTSSSPAQIRDGRPTRTGPEAMPGPQDTYIAYGLNWANISNTPFREYKHFVHEGGISTPLIVHWPNGLKRTGELEKTPAHLIDIVPTCLTLAGAPQDFKFATAEKPAPSLAGVSLSPLFGGQNITREALYWEHEGNRAIRVGDWKLVAKEDQPWELYDVSKDRGEQHNLAAEHPDRVKDMAAKWDAWAERSQVLPVGGWRRSAKETALESKRDYTLTANAELAADESPRLKNRGFNLTVTLAKPGTGTLIAQGGSAHGWALWIEGETLHFGVRKEKELQEVTAPLGETSKLREIGVRLGKKGMVALSINGVTVAEKQKLETLDKQPGEGLTVGREDRSTVGTATGAKPFSGEISNITLQLTK